MITVYRVFLVSLFLSMFCFYFVFIYLYFFFFFFFQAEDGIRDKLVTGVQTCAFRSLDIMLPKMNGYEICRALRARKLEMPIIMLTAKGQEEDIIRGLELGADDYVTKPFSIRQLLARARAFLRRQNGCAAAFSFGACKLDLAAHKLFRDEVEVALTTKEFQLLKFLISRPGRALTRDQILDAVWGSEIVVNDRSVDRCVTTLRARVEIDP